MEVVRKEQRRGEMKKAAKEGEEPRNTARAVS